MKAFDEWWLSYCEFEPSDKVTHAARMTWEAAVGHCIRVIETYRVPVGNSSSGELACEWTMEALREIRDTLSTGTPPDGVLPEDVAHGRRSPETCPLFDTNGLPTGCAIVSHDAMVELPPKQRVYWHPRTGEFQHD